MSIRNTLPTSDYTAAPNKFVTNEIPEGSLCLDVGCWTGNLGEYLIKNKKCLMEGVDHKKDVLLQAEKKGYKKTYCINLNNDPISFAGLKKKYQVIICADILEHLINPVGILGGLKKHLAEDGFFVISLPNVAFALYRMQLLLGKWNYKEFGTLDKTHLRFYTIQTGVEMVKSARLQIIKVNPYNQFGILRYIKPFDTIFPSLLAYQFVIIAKI